MSEVIAIIKLAPGEVGYYDELSKIHLTISRPKANVYDYMNTSRLLRSVKSKTLILVAGSLVPVNKEKKEVEEVIAVKEETVEIPPVVVPATPAEPIVIEEVKAEEVVVEETAKVEEVVEEPVVEKAAEPKKEKKSRNKKKKEE